MSLYRKLTWCTTLRPTVGLDNHGTLPNNVGNLLDLYGVHSHHGQGVEQMINELRQGHKVIVGVNVPTCGTMIIQSQMILDIYLRGTVQIMQLL